MNWEALGAIGEIVGAVAVVVTLGYLAVQIRQNTRQLDQNAELLRVSARQAVKRDVQEVRLLSVQNPEHIRMLRSGFVDLNSLDDEEKAQFSLLIAVFFDQYAFAWELRDKNPGEWQVREKQMRNYLSQPGIRTWWEAAGRDLHQKDFVRYVEEVALTTTEPSAPHWLRA